MIEVNLIPGGKKRASRGPRLSLSMPDLGRLSQNRWVVGAVAAGILVVAYAGLRYFSVNGRQTELAAQLDSELADSARYADLITRTQRLSARRDSIAGKVLIIQEIDADRYVWPHILDEVARAVPDYTWLTNLVQTGGGGGAPPEFRIEGFTGNTFALTTFIQALEASPFIRNVTLVSTEQTQVPSTRGGSRDVYRFTLDMAYEVPPEELIETVPLFGGETPGLPDVPADSAAVPDTAAAEGN